MKRQFSRQQLYELVWSQPMRTVAARMGISDIALAKMCRKANIPVPPHRFAGQFHRTPPRQGRRHDGAGIQRLGVHTPFARSGGRPSSRDILHVNDLLKLRQKFLMILSKVSNYTGVAEKFR